MSVTINPITRAALQERRAAIINMYPQLADFSPLCPCCGYDEALRKWGDDVADAWGRLTEASFLLGRDT